MNPKNKLAEMPVRPLLYTMAVPLMLSLLIQSLYNIVDSIFVARLSETALTAASLVYAIQFLMIAIGVGTAVGLNALLSRKLGQKKPEEACRAATTGLFLMLGTSLVFTLVGLLFSNQLAAALTNDPELQQLCREYLSVNLVFCWGIFLQTYGQRLFIWTLLAWVRMASRLLSSRLFQRVISVPSKSTIPLSRAISRDNIPITVDFPAPFGPIRERTLPFGISKLTPSTTALPS